MARKALITCNQKFTFNKIQFVRSPPRLNGFTYGPEKFKNQSKLMADNNQVIFKHERETLHFEREINHQ